MKEGTIANWEEVLLTKGISGLRWPYPIRYDIENEVTADVLVLGGGIAGCCVAHCPRAGAIRLNHPLMRRVRWKRKETGEHFRV